MTGTGVVTVGASTIQKRKARSMASDGRPSTVARAALLAGVVGRVAGGEEVGCNGRTLHLGIGFPGRVAPDCTFPDLLRNPKLFDVLGK